MNCLNCGKNPVKFRRKRDHGKGFCSPRCNEIHYNCESAAVTNNHKELRTLLSEKGSDVNAQWSELPLGPIQRILESMPITEIWRLCATETRVRRLCQDKGWRVDYLKKQPTSEIQAALDDAFDNIDSKKGFIINWIADAMRLQKYDPIAGGNFVILKSIGGGHVEVVKLLLADHRVNPSINDNFAIVRASANGYVEMVKLLLADKRVDPSVDDNWAIQEASKNGHVEVVKLLLANPRVKRSLSKSDVILFEKGADVNAQ